MNNPVTKNRIGAYILTLDKTLFNERLADEFSLDLISYIDAVKEDPEVVLEHDGFETTYEYLYFCSWTWINDKFNCCSEEDGEVVWLSRASDDLMVSMAGSLATVLDIVVQCTSNVVEAALGILHEYENYWDQGDWRKESQIPEKPKMTMEQFLKPHSRPSTDKKEDR